MLPLYIPKSCITQSANLTTNVADVFLEQESRHTISLDMPLNTLRPMDIRLVIDDCKSTVGIFIDLKRLLILLTIGRKEGRNLFIRYKYKT